MKLAAAAPTAHHFHHELRQHRAAVLSVRFSSDGNYCISTSQDKSLILWNPTAPRAIKTYQGPHNHEVNDVAITGDNSRFASVGGDKAAFLWDVTTGSVIRRFIGHQGKVNCCDLARHADDTVLATGSYDKAVRLWDLRASGRDPIQILDEARDSISCVSMEEPGLIYVASVDGLVRSYDLRMGCINNDDFESPIVGFSLSKSARCYTANCLDSSVHLVESRTGNILNTFRGHLNNHYKVNAQMDPSESYVVSGSEDGKIFFWDICHHGEAPPLKVISATTHALSQQKAITPTSPNVAWGCIFCVRFHPTLNYMITCHNDRALRVWRDTEKQAESV